MKDKTKKLDVKIIKVDLESKKELEKLMFEYFQEIDNSKISEKNELTYPFLDLYWKEEFRKPFFINFQNENIGFVLINNWVLNKEFNANYSIAEFYVAPKYRRIGIGNKVVVKLFTMYKGKWEVRQAALNSIAITFWRKCINDFTKGNYFEMNFELNGMLEILQFFKT